MIVPESDLHDECETEQLIRWRFRELVRAGYELDAALEVAVHVEVDLHRASELLRDGCPPDTARRILL